MSGGCVKTLSVQWCIFRFLVVLGGRGTIFEIKSFNTKMTSRFMVSRLLVSTTIAFGRGQPSDGQI